jgi:predicted transcriptional regulator
MGAKYRTVESDDAVGQQLLLAEIPYDELRELMAEIRAWTWAKHGRSKEMAEALRVSEETVSRWVNGRKRPSLKKFFELRDFLKEQGS